jgi:hypothetical protein
VNDVLGRQFSPYSTLYICGTTPLNLEFFALVTSDWSDFGHDKIVFTCKEAACLNMAKCVGPEGILPDLQL